MSEFYVAPEEIKFSLNNIVKYRIYNIYTDIYIELGSGVKFGINKTTPTEDIHIGGSLHLNNPLDVKYNSGFKITVNNNPLAFVPIGTIVLWPVPNTSTVINPMLYENESYAGNYYESLPYGWILCEGQSLSISEFPILYDIIGKNYGGSGSFFRVPDFSDGYGIVNRDTTNTSRNMYAVYDRPVTDGDINNYILTTANLPQHRHRGTTGESTDHVLPFHQHNYKTVSGCTGGIGGGDQRAECANVSGRTSGAQTLQHNHNGIQNTTLIRSGIQSAVNLEQPYIVLRYIICIF